MHSAVLKSQAPLSYPRFSAHMASHIGTSVSCHLMSQPLQSTEEQERKEEGFGISPPPFFLLILLYRQHQPLKSQNN